jgi:hypothetical protein
VGLSVINDDSNTPVDGTISSAEMNEREESLSSRLLFAELIGQEMGGRPT